MKTPDGVIIFLESCKTAKSDGAEFMWLSTWLDAASVLLEMWVYYVIRGEFTPTTR